MKNFLIRLLSLPLLLLAGCQITAFPPITLARDVDLQRFMGDWHVIANIPTFIEKGAHNAVESYRLAPDGTVATTFTFRDAGFDGPEKRYHPRGYVQPGTGNAVWGMQFIWPFKADYRIAYVDRDYRVTIVAREKRDYIWIMAREPQIPEADYQKLIEFAAAQGYDVSKIERVPQQPRPGAPS